MIRLAHVITGLSTGGAEMMLSKVIAFMDRSAFDLQVYSLTDIGPVGKAILEQGVPVRALGMRRGVPNPLAVVRLARWLRRDRPHLVQTWMYHADLTGGLAAKLAGGVPVVWGVHHSNLDPRVNRRSTIWTAGACARLSRLLPDRIVCCGESVRRAHAAIGYAPEKMVVIPNGFDLARFRPDPAARASVRAELGVPESAALVGLMGRFHPQKDHKTFVLAAARLQARVPEVHFLLCGDGVTWENPALREWIEDAGLRRRFHLLGRREDVPRLTAALDIAASSSVGEGFPNVIGEAMACGVPCAVTDVGDSALIVGETGKVVPPADPDALAAAWSDLIGMGRESRSRLGAMARRRVEDRFSLSAIVGRYEQLYREMLPT